MRWSTPEDLLAQVERLWANGRILSSMAHEDGLFPLRLRFRGPTSSEWSSCFEDACAWVERMRSVQSIRIVWKDMRHPVLGNNRFPCEVWVDTREDAVRIVRGEAEAERFAGLLAETSRREPCCVDWMARNPLDVLKHADAWSRLLDIVGWIERHPRPGIYMRELDLPGVDTKFLESHRSVLSELLDLVLPETVIDTEAKDSTRFEERYGFRSKPRRVRFRMSREAGGSGSFAGAVDVEIEADAFSRWDPTTVDRVFVVENEVTFLAFPDVPRSIVVLGGGYGFESLRDADWMRQRRVFYWGDLDTHGFAILDQFRATFPEASSFLMDRATLLSHRDRWTSEPKPASRILSRLTDAEQSLYSDLLEGAWGDRVRLEQERIGFRLLEAALASLKGSAASWIFHPPYGSTPSAIDRK